MCVCIVTNVMNTAKQKHTTCFQIFLAMFS